MKYFRALFYWEVAFTPSSWVVCYYHNDGYSLDVGFGPFSFAYLKWKLKENR